MGARQQPGTPGTVGAVIQRTPERRRGRGQLPSLAGVEGKPRGLVEGCGHDAPLLQLSTLFTYFNRIFGFLTRILDPGDSLLP